MDVRDIDIRSAVAVEVGDADIHSLISVPADGAEIIPFEPFEAVAFIIQTQIIRPKNEPTNPLRPIFGMNTTGARPARNNATDQVPPH